MYAHCLVAYSEFLTMINEEVNRKSRYNVANTRNNTEVNNQSVDTSYIIYITLAY